MALLLCLPSSAARADCPAAPIGDPDDMAISFLASYGVQAASASLLASSVKEGTLIYDDADDRLKVCDGTNWIAVGAGSGSDTLASLACAAGQIAKYNGAAWACAADENAGGGSGVGLEYFAGSTLLVGNINYHNVTPTNNYPVTVPSATKAVKLIVHYNHNSGTAGTHGYLGFLAYQKGQTAANKKVSYFSQHFDDYANSDIAYLDIPWDDSLDDQVTIQVTSSYNTDPLNIYSIYFGGYVVGGGGGSDSLSGLSCNSGQVPSWNGSAWQCADMAGGGVPAGTIAAFSASTCPAGWSEYVAARGRFLRGIDNGAGNDPSGTRAPGDVQVDEIKSHLHGVDPPQTSTSSDGAHTHTVSDAYVAAADGDIDRDWDYTNGMRDSTTRTTSSAGIHAHTVDIAAFNSGPTGGSETRPKNVAVIFCQYSGSGGGGGATAEAAGDAGQIQFNDGTDAFAADAGLVWDNVNKRLGIGTDAPVSPLEVVSTNAADTSLTVTKFGTSGVHNGVAFRGARGTPSAPAATQSGDRSLYLIGSTFGGSTWANTAAINFYASQNQTETARGSRMTFDTVANGTTSRVERMRIGQDGNVGIGTTVPQSLLHVAGGIQLSDDSAACPGASNVKVGTLKYASNALSICNAGGWIALSTSSGATATANVGYVQIAGAGGTFADSGTSGGQSLFWDNVNKRLGVGTATPASKVQIWSGSTENTSALSINGGGDAADEHVAYLLGRASAFPATVLRLASNAVAGSSYKFVEAVSDEDGTPVTQFLVRGDGNVGIGTSAPDHRLVVQTADNASADGISIVSPNSGNIALRPDVGAGGANPLVQAGDAAFVYTDGTINTGNLFIGPWSSSSAGMRMTSGGRVGIGTATPLGKLDVADVLYTGTSGILFVRPENGVNEGGQVTLMGAASHSSAKIDNYAGDLRLFWDDTAARQVQVINGGTGEASLYVEGNVGIGTSSPSTKLEVGGDRPIRIDPDSGNVSTKGDAGGWAFRYGAIGSSGTDSGGFGVYGGADTLHYYWIGTDYMNPKMTIRSSGNVGIGTTTPAYMLQVNGTVAGASAYVNTSDGRLKRDVHDLDYGLDTVMRLHAVSFQWNEQAKDWQKGRKLGLIAQEAEKVIPEVVSTAKDDIGTKSIAYGDLTPVLIKAIQELKADNDNLRIELKAANDNYADLRREIEGLKAATRGGLRHGVQ